MSDDRLTYQEAWDAYCCKMLSTDRLLKMQREDEVFRLWLIRKVKTARARMEAEKGA